MKNILFIICLGIYFPLNAQLSFQKKSGIQVPLKSTLNFGTMPAGFEPAILREAPIPKKPENLNSSKNMSQPETQFNNLPKTQTLNQPIVLKSFAGQGYQFSAPNDNHLAVGANGKLISVVNTNITAYDTASNVLFSNSLATFADTLGTLGYTFDPRVIYDPISDRYIVTFLNGFLDSTSQIIIAFSKTADPEGEWNLYLLNGNPLNNFTWSDYPAIGISQQELFITFNTFTNGSTNNTGYIESTIWQIDKQKGYAGDTLISDYYYDIKWAGDTLFNTTPVTGGTLPYGPNMYFLNTNPSSIGTDTLYVLEITNTIASGNATLQASVVTMGTQYFEPIEAKQKSNHTLITNDARIQSAILENDVLHFTLNTKDPVSLQAAIYYGRVRQFSGSRNAQAIIISDTLDLAYGAIAYIGNNTTSESVVLPCLHSSITTNAGQSAFYVDDNMAVSSRSIVKSGNGILNVLSGTSERWGDYTGISIQPGEPGSVWFSGSYSSSNARNMTWVSKIGIGQTNVSNAVSFDQNSEINVYPNPAKEKISVSYHLENAGILEFSIYDLQGKIIRRVLRDWMRSGKQEFTFNCDPLPSGLYILKIEDANHSEIASRKFSVLR